MRALPMGRLGLACAPIGHLRHGAGGTRDDRKASFRLSRRFSISRRAGFESSASRSVFTSSKCSPTDRDR